MKKVLNALKFVWTHNKVWEITTAIVIALIITVSLVVTQNTFLYGTVKTLLGGERRVLVEGDHTKYQYYTTNSEDFLAFETQSEFKNKKDTLKEANRLNQLIAEEGFVLLKNENKALPIKTPISDKTVSSKPKISIFGKNSTSLVYGGSGSGNGDTKSTVGIYEAMNSAGFDCNPTLEKFYKSRAAGTGRSKNPDMGNVTFGLMTGETPQSSYTSAVKNSYAQYSDAAFVVISRIGGEGFDLPRTMTDDKGNVLSGSSKGDHYLELDNNEKDLLQTVCAQFDKVVLIINCATSMELGFLDEETYDIDAALWIASPGGSGISALGRIINGQVNPSGRTVDTYARDFTLDPVWNNIGNNNTVDGNRYTIGVNGSPTSSYFVEYEESIYVGYRYYETRAYMQQRDYADFEWYDKNVVFPFGYGLSYTNFDWEIVQRQPEDGSTLTANQTVKIEVAVTNKGQYAGKDVVQMYYSAPYRIVNNKGQVEKAHVVLGDYAKTPLIQPNETKNVVLELKVSDMASYDYNDANLNGNKGYELDMGNYNIRIGKNAHDCWMGENALQTVYGVSQTVNLAKDAKTEATVENRFDDVSSHIESYLSRENFEGTKTTMPTAQDLSVNTEFINSLKYDQATYDKKYGADTYVTDKMPTTGYKPKEGEKAHKLYDVINFNESTGLIDVDYKNEIFDELLNRLSVKEMATLIGTGNFNTAYLDSIDKPKTIDPDGPAGFTNFMGDPSVYDTCFYVSECVVAATFNKDLAHDMGVMVGIEGIVGYVKGDGRPYSGWYAPAVNIHRSPFSGRNWEYYSEDPLLSGKMGAHVVQGAKSKGVYTYVKHFAINDQETNRDSNGLITWLNEQSMREIYLKPFEIIVKEGGTNAMMSSFNRIGTVWAGGSYELLTEVLREEWGFQGMVITDYNLQSGGYMSPNQMLRAGGDLNLVQGGLPAWENADATQVSLMRTAVKNILYTVSQSNAMNGMGEGNVWAYAQPTWVIIMIVVDIVIVLGLAAWGFFAIRRSLIKSKEGKEKQNN